MKPFKEVINYSADNSFIIRYNEFEHFSFPYHFHNEYEIIYVIESTGKRVVGDVEENFGPEDLVFFGSTLPHYYLNDKQYYTGNPDLKLKAYIIQFSSNYFSEDQLKRPEFSAIQRLLTNSCRGLKFPESTRKAVASMIQKIYEDNGLNRYLLLIELLNFLGQADFSSIASAGYSKNTNYNIDDRLIKVYEFSTQNYNKKISLHEVASVAGMNPTAFCRYFHGKAGKNFAEFVNDLRIKEACNLLRNGNKTIVFICFETGFNNVSNFNRQFKAKIGKSPSAYRKFALSQIS